MISVATREPRHAKYDPPRPHPKLRLTRAQKSAAHRAETAVAYPGRTGAYGIRPLVADPRSAARDYQGAC